MKQIIKDLLESKNIKYKECKDTFIDIAKIKYASVLKKHNIELVVINSDNAANQIITNNDNHYLVWDTNYWNYCLIYYCNLRKLDYAIKNKKDLVNFQCDVIWSDLFRIALNRVNMSDRQRLSMLKYYLKYGFVDEISNINNSKKAYDEIKEHMIVARSYCFFHELAHITYIDEAEKYYELIKEHFCKDNKDNLLAVLVHGINNPELISFFNLIINDYINNAEKNVFKCFNEIIAEIRTMQSFINNYGKRYIGMELLSKLIEAKKGISLIRSYRFKIKTIAINIESIINPDAIDRIAKEFCYDFIVLDRIIEYFDMYIISENLVKQNFNRKSIEKYFNSYEFDSKCINTFDDYLKERLLLLKGYYNKEIKYEICDNVNLKIINDYLLYYDDIDTENNNSAICDDILI